MRYKKDQNFKYDGKGRFVATSKDGECLHIVERGGMSRREMKRFLSRDRHDINVWVSGGVK